jgi:hypothetical protein
MGRQKAAGATCRMRPGAGAKVLADPKATCLTPVIPAKAAIQCFCLIEKAWRHWMPADMGTTKIRMLRLSKRHCPLARLADPTFAQTTSSGPRHIIFSSFPRVRVR